VLGFTPDDYSAILLSVKVATVATLLSLPFGFGVAYIMTYRRFPGKVALDVAVNLPLTLPPVVIGGRCLVDGGVLDNLPIDLARSLGAERVIAVDVSSGAYRGDDWDPLRSASRMPDFLEMAFNAVGVMVTARTRAKLQSHPPDVLICPRLPHDIGTFSSFTRAAEIMRLGEQAAAQALLEHSMGSEPLSMRVLGAEV
jgi:predicted acylesterase/phospholipase RssA